MISESRIGLTDNNSDILSLEVYEKKIEFG